jgi:hypothetical protein
MQYLVKDLKIGLFVVGIGFDSVDKQSSRTAFMYNAECVLSPA